MTNYIVSSGQTSSGILVNNGDLLTVLGGGTVTLATVNAGGIVSVTANGSLSNLAISGGTLILSGTGIGGSNNGFAAGTTGGTVVLGSGLGSQNAGTGYLLLNGVTSGNTVSVLAGGGLSPETVSGGGVVVVAAGGFVNGTTIASGGIERVAGGGLVEGATTLSSGGVLSGGTIVSGTVTVATGGTLSGTLNVSATGVLSNGTIGNAVTLNVLSGGVTADTTVSSGSTDNVSAGGVASGTLVVGGRLIASNGGLVAGTSGYSAIFAQFTGGGVITVGNEMLDFGSATPVYNNNTLNLVSGGSVASGAFISGTLNVSAGGLASGLSLFAGGTVNVSSGGVVNSSTTSGGANFNVLNGGATTGISLLSRGAETVASGGIANATTIVSGEVRVAAGGVANGTNVGSGTDINVAAGGLLSGVTTVTNGTAILNGTAGAGTISLVGSGARVTLSGTTLATNSIGGFVTGDQIDLANFASGTFTVTSTTDTLTISSGGVAQTLNILGVGNFGHTLTADGGGGTIYAACFAEGTHIATPDGDVAVEQLAPGRLVTTIDGPAAIRWIGRRAVDFTRAGPDVAALLPIRISRGAMADNVPHRDLLVSPEHAIYLQGVMVPARHLVNGTTVATLVSVTRIRYFHIELESHGVLYSEGLATESWLDTGNRGMFENAAEAVVQHPAYAAQTAQTAWESFAYAPLVTSGDILAGIRNALIEPAILIGAMTREPHVTLAVDGEELMPATMTDRRYSFTVPRGVREVAIVSRSVRGANALGDPGEQRRLGVALSGIAISAPVGKRRVGLSDPALRDGFGVAEGPDAAPFRWTDGFAVIPAFLLDGFEGGFELTLDIAGTVAYPVEASTMQEERLTQVG